MNNDNTKSFYRRKRYVLPLLLIAGLIAFRIYLPTLVKNYVNKVLADIPDYYGQVEDIDIALFRGAYVIKGLYLNKVDAQTQVPFINLPETDISVEWKSIFKGKIVSEIYLYQPEVIYVQEDMDEEDVADEEDWTKALTDLVPLDINHFEIQDGKLAFVQVNADPTIDLQLNQLYLTADNLRNVVAKERILPSPISGKANSIGNGQLKLDGNVNLIKEIPDMDIALSLEKVDIAALNDFSSHYAKIDFEKGDLGLFTEMAIADGFLKGYFKVLVEDTKFIGPEDQVFEKIWEGFVSFFKYILQNQKTDTFAVKAPLEGDLNNIETGVWSAIGSIFKNAFIEAFQSEIDDEVEYQDAFTDEDNGNTAQSETEKAKWWQLGKKIKQNKEEKEQSEQIAEKQ